MRHFVLGWILIMFASIALCCPTGSAPGLNAVKALYWGKEITQYVCHDEPCDINEFAERLSLKKIRLAKNAHTDDGLQIEPSVKGRQYFSYIYLFDQSACDYVPVFSADTSFSGVQVLKDVRHGYHTLRAHEQRSIDRFSETDFFVRSCQA